MKKIIYLATLAISLLVSTPILAHEGHDHDGPSSFQPKNGGVVKSTEEVNVEVVTKDQNLEIYFYDNAGNPFDLTKLQFKAEAQLPKSKKKTAIALEQKATFQEAKFDAKGAHRYTLILHLTLKEENAVHKDTLKFTIEPKK
jgi:hypothetical protein